MRPELGWREGDRVAWRQMASRRRSLPIARMSQRLAVPAQWGVDWTGGGALESQVTRYE